MKIMGNKQYERKTFLECFAIPIAIWSLLPIAKFPLAIKFYPC